MLEGATSVRTASIISENLILAVTNGAVVNYSYGVTDILCLRHPPDGRATRESRISMIPRHLHHLLKKAERGGNRTGRGCTEFHTMSSRTDLEVRPTEGDARVENPCYGARAGYAAASVVSGWSVVVGGEGAWAASTRRFWRRVRSSSDSRS
jgi:hypothetical protein